MANFGKLNFAVALEPTSAFPLDGRTYFESKEAAELAASTSGPVGSTDTKYHYGMILTVCENDDISLWTIMPDKSLTRVTLSVTMSQEEYNKLAESGSTNSGILYLIAGDVS